MQIVDAQSRDHFQAVRRLCWEYRDFLLSLGGTDAEAVLHFYPVEKYARLMEGLEAEHMAPAGGIKLALQSNTTIGCGMFHTFAPGTAEIKRVYVRQDARGTGAGRAIMESLVAACRAAGFRRILMDTGRALTAAQGLYLSMGFRARGPYQDLPEELLPLLRFFEMEL